jgi:hypothetical protein
LRDLAGLVFLLLSGELGRPLVDRDVRAEELEQQRQQFGIGLGPQPLGFGLAQQAAPLPQPLVALPVETRATYR